MSKRIRLTTTILALMLAGLCGLYQAPAGHSQRPQATSSASRNAAMVAATADVLKETSQLRQLPILRPVQSSTQSRSEIERMVLKNLDEETSAADMHAEEVALKKLGLAPADFQYRALMTRVLTEQVAGYYDPKTRQFHLADWIDLDGQKPIMAHELTHALQDQHFDLRRFEHWPKGDSDAELAAHALIEGDATLAMALYVASNPLRALQFLKSLGATGMASEELDKAPRALKETLLFPYQEGMNWARTLHRRGGWKEVSDAFRTLPQSSEQILHPEKYFAHEAPVKVTLADLTSLLNGTSANRAAGSAGINRQRFAGLAEVGSPLIASRELISAFNLSQETPRRGDVIPAAGWKRLMSDVQGEWGLYLLLDQFLQSPAESRRASAGWAGDRMAVYEGPNGAALIVAVSAWDTESDAQEFFDAYVKRTGLRYSGATRMDSTDPNRVQWQTNEGAVAVELSGSRVTIVEGVPEKVDMKAIMTALR
jgi:hypothetical protein